MARLRRRPIIIFSYGSSAATADYPMNAKREWDNNRKAIIIIYSYGPFVSPLRREAVAEDGRLYHKKSVFVI